MKLVTVYTSISINEVNYIKSLLESKGLKTAILDDTIAQVAPHYLFGQGGARLAVSEQDAPMAKKIIAEYEEDKKNLGDQRN